MIKVGMDIRPLLKEGSGVGYYIKGLVSALSSYPDIKFELFSSSWKDRFDVKKHFPGLDLSIHDCRYPVSLLNFLWQRLKYPPIDKFLPKVDIVHSTYSYYIPTKGKNEIITIHDLFHLKKPELAGVKDVKGEFDLIKNSAERAQRIIAVSEFTKNEIVNILGISDEKIEVIHSAPTLEPELSRLGEKRNNKRTILSVGTLEHRKNHIKLIEAFRMAKKKVKESKLVIVGKEGFGVQEIQRKKSELSLLDDVTFTGYIDEVNLKDQYYNADLFIFPSMEEGFGFPPLDAMNFNIPVISSRTGALPEILKDASYYVDHDDPTSIADAIIKVLGDNTLMVDLIQKGTNLVKTYTWENTAEKTYQLYRSLL